MSDTTHDAPLSDDDLDEMRRLAEYAIRNEPDMRGFGNPLAVRTGQGLLVALNEVDRLLAERERLLALVRAVAEVNATNGSDPDDMRWPCCAFSSACEPVWSEHFIEWRHAADCPVTQARTALASAAADASANDDDAVDHDVCGDCGEVADHDLDICDCCSEMVCRACLERHRSAALASAAVDASEEG